MKLVRTGGAVHRPVVAQRRASVIDASGQDLADGGVKPSGRRATNPAAGWMEPGGPEGFIGIDVPDASHRALAEELGLDRLATSTQRRPQAGRCELGIERLRSERGQRGQR